MRWIPFINLLLVTLIGISLTGAVFTLCLPSKQIEPASTVFEKQQLPLRPFPPAKLTCLEDDGPLALNWVEPTLELPNLTTMVHYHGIIERPDSCPSKPRFLISLADTNDLYTLQSEQPFYLVYTKPTSYDDGQGPLWGEEPKMVEGYYPTEKQTGLWLQMTPRNNGKALDVTVHMVDENNQELVSPTKYRRFTVLAQEAPKRMQANWELGDLRVDSTLLIRQKARWTGPDRFLINHGGKEYAHVLDRERIDFYTNERPYSCFIKAGDFLVWSEGRWKENYLFEDSTLNLPLLSVKKIDDKLITFELWDFDGISKLSLNLIKARDVAGMPELSEELRFVGAKTWAQFIVESRSGRFILRPYDWLVLTQEGWVKLDSSKKIDDYVNQKLVGPLLVLNKMGKQQGKQILMGHLYNLSRSEVQEIEIPAIVGAYINQGPLSLPAMSIPESLASREL